MKIALGQLESGADISATLAVIGRFAAHAAHDGAELVAFPKYATYEKKNVDATFPAVAEPLDGPICRELADIARRQRIALVAGVVETSEEPGRAYKTLVAFGPTARGWISTGRSTFSTRRASGSGRSSSRGRPPNRWCSSTGECGSG